MNSYKINDFAKKIGVTVKTLRHYEKFKIVSPAVNPENGYRFYTFRDGERIITAKRLSSMGFSIRETAELLDNCSSEHAIQLLNERANAVSREAMRLELMSRRLHELADETSLFVTHPNDGFICEGKEYWFVPHVSDDALHNDQQTVSAVEQMMDAMPFCSKMMVLQNDETGYTWGLSIESTYADALGMVLDQPARHIPPARCLVIPHIIKKIKNNRTGSDWHLVLNTYKSELERLHLTAAGPIYVIGGIDSFDCDFREKHFLIFVPIAD